MKKGSKILIGIGAVAAITTAGSAIATNYAIGQILKAKRKSKEIAISEAKTRFDSDYNDYKDIEVEEITLQSKDGLALKGYYHKVFENTDKVVIIHHGYTANHYITYQFTDMFFEMGYNVLLIDMRSHGESQGDYASYGIKEMEDLEIWVDFIKSKLSKDGIIGLHGQSMGGATVLLYGGEKNNKVSFIISDCAYSNAREEIKFQFEKTKVPFYPLYNLTRRRVLRRYGFDLNKINPLESIKQSNIPTMFIHGNSDNTVPMWMSEEMYKLKNGKLDRLYIVEGADHMEAYSKDKEEYKKRVKEFVREIEDLKEK